MKYPLLWTLASINAFLTWSIFASGTSGGTGWRPPAAQPLDAADLAPVRLTVPAPDPAALRPMLERPLFAPDRRPPGSGATAVADSSDPIGQASLIGLARTDEGATALLRVEGEVRRLHAGQAIGPWTFVDAEGRHARFRGIDGATRLLPLNRATQARAPDAAQEPPSSSEAEPEVVASESHPPDEMDAASDPSFSEALEQRIAERRARREALEARRNRSQ